MASVHIQDKVFFSFKLNGNELKGAQNIFSKVTILHGFGLTIPQMQLVLNDMHGYLTGDLAVNDGTRIEVTLGKNPDTSKTAKFVVVGIKHGNDENGNLLYINCLLDAPKFNFEAARDIKNGSSIEALKYVAERGGLKHKTDVSTSDTMRWINCGEPRSQFVQRITRHCYNGAQSCVYTCPNIYAELMTFDLFKLLEKEPVATFCYSFDEDSKDIKGSAILVEEVRPVTISGVFNSWTNFGHVHDQHTMKGNKPLDFVKANPVVMGDGLPLNQDLKSEIEGSQISWGAFFDVGTSAECSAFNLHGKFYDADYLNTRHLALFTEGLKISIDTFTDLSLYDTVQYTQTDNLDGGDVPNQRYDGKYLIGGQAIVIQGHHYIEVLDLYRSFVAESGKNNLVGGGANSAVDGQIPSNAGGGLEEDGMMNGGNVSVDDATANKFEDKVSSVTDKDAFGEQSLSDKLSSMGDKFSGQLDDLKNKFKETSQDFSFDSLVDKYGSDADFLDALMSEFSGAKALLDLCRSLGDLELASLEFAKLNAPSIFDALEERLDWINDLMSGMEGDINDLIGSGELDGESLKDAHANLECLDYINNALEDAVNGLLPDACLPNLIFDNIKLPQLELGQIADKIDKFLEDLLCSIGKELDKAVTGKGEGGNFDIIDDVKDSLEQTKDKFTDSIKESGDSIKDFGDSIKDIPDQIKDQY